MKFFRLRKIFDLSDHALCSRNSKPVVFSLKALFQPDSEFSFTVTNKATQGIESGIENEILLPSSILAPFQVL